MKNPQIWHPAPRGLIQSAAIERWTREQPAPDLVVYLWTWSQRDDNEHPTRRQLARLFGWTEHRARQMLARVADDHKSWLKSFSPTLRNSPRPPQPNNGAQLHEQFARKSPKNHHDSPDHAHAITLKNTKTQATGTSTSTSAKQEYPSWRLKQ
jgi:hypothetical protein